MVFNQLHWLPLPLASDEKLLRSDQSQENNLDARFLAWKFKYLTLKILTKECRQLLYLWRYSSVNSNSKCFQFKMVGVLFTKKLISQPFPKISCVSFGCVMVLYSPWVVLTIVIWDWWLSDTSGFWSFCLHICFLGITYYNTFVSSSNDKGE